MLQREEQKMPPVDDNLMIGDEDCPITSELDAYKEATRVMLGFRTLEEMGNIFRRELVWKAMLRLEDALKITRARRQPEEFALALAIEEELLKRARDQGKDLEKVFNDPNHHEPPSEQIANMMIEVWNGD
jgi:hypothetical protein